VATGFIDSREIKNNEVRSIDVRNNEIRTRDLRNNEVRGIDLRNSTVQGRDIQLNTVTGDDVREDTLQKVPSALLADSATTAGSADAVGGVSMKPISFSAEAGGAYMEILNFEGLTLKAKCNGTETVDVVANPTVADGEFNSLFLGGQLDNDFNPNDDARLALGSPNEPGQAIYVAADGHVVTIHGMTVQDQNDVRGTTNDCGFFGIAEAG
jgi:hypothetical protein